MSIDLSNQKPALVTAIAIMTLLSGIVNIFWGLLASMLLLPTIVGILCIPLATLPTILGIFEIIYAAKLLGTPPKPVRFSATLAVLEISCILAFNAFSMIVGILCLVFYNDLTVKAYFEGIHGADPSSPFEAPALSEPELRPAASASESPDLLESSVEPNLPDTSESPRLPRKVA